MPNWRLHLTRAPFGVPALDYSQVVLLGRAVSVDRRGRSRAGEAQ